MPIYMKMDGITGDATEGGHQQWIRVNSVQFGVGRSISTPVGATANREASHPSVSEISLTRSQDTASAQLFQEALVGDKGKTVQLDFLTTGNPGTVYYTVILTNTLISSYSLTSHGDRPEETLGLNFTKIEYNFLGTKEDRSAGSGKKAAFDLSAGRAS